jgi:NADH-quinone oxidoreductase subunit M
MLSGWKRENLSGLIYFSSFLLFLEFLLLLAFSTMNIFVFYIAFEATLIPMFFIIGI